MKIENILKKYTKPEILLLLSFIANKPKEYLLAHPELKISFWQKIKFFYLWKKFKTGVPLAYLTGHKEFFGLDFLVNKHTLIPRPDTKILVETAIREISNIQPAFVPGELRTGKYPISDLLLIDVGTGTGCIPITILKRLKKKPPLTPLPTHQSFAWCGADAYQNKINRAIAPHRIYSGEGGGLTTIATDISKKALKVARKNAKKHDVKINFLHGDLLSPIFKNFQSVFAKAMPDKLSTFNFQTLIITANLPYLKEEWWHNEPSIKKEPKTALVSDNDTGLNLYKKLLQQIQNLQSSIYNLQSTIFLEIDPRQSAKIVPLIQKYLPQADIAIIKDLSGFDRIVKIKQIKKS